MVVEQENGETDDIIFFFFGNLALIKLFSS